MYPESDGPKNLLIIRTDRIGDLILSLPLAEIIKRNYPFCKVSYLIREYPKALLSGNKYIDEVLILEEKGGKPDYFGLIKKLKESKFDTAIILNPKFESVLTTYLAGIKLRISTGYRWYSFLLNGKVFEHRKYGEKHELEYNVNFLQRIGITETISPGSVNFPLHISSGASQKIAEVLKKHQIKQNGFIIIHPGSGGSAADLPIQRYKELADLIVEKIGCNIILTGSSAEVGLCGIISENNPNIINLAGVFNLEELIAIVDKSAIFISNSTGPLHIAAALNKWVIGFYPNKKDCSSKRWGPYTKKAKIFTPPKRDCAECRMEQCGAKECMNNIKVTDVLVDIEKICTFLSNNGEFNV